MYQVNWHEKYGDPARRSLNWLLRTVRTPGRLPGSVYTRGPLGAEAVVDAEVPPGAGACNPYHVFTPALRLFPSKTLKDFVLAQAECGVGLPQAYELTGDPEYAAAALDHLMRHKTTIGPDDIMCFYNSEYTEQMPPLMKTVAMAAEADPDGFWEYARKWREEQKAKPDAKSDQRTEQEDGTSLGVLSTGPHPQD